MAPINSCYKLLFLSSLWVSFSSLFEITTIETETTTVTTTTTKLRINRGFQSEDYFSQPTTTTSSSTNRSSIIQNNDVTTTTVINNSSSESNHRSKSDLKIEELSKNSAIKISSSQGEYTTTTTTIPKDGESSTTKEEKWTKNPVASRGLFRNCTSPEASILWPFHPDDETFTQSTTTSPVASSLLNPHLKCGLGLGRGGSNERTKDRFLDYFETKVKKTIIQPILDQEGCHDLVVFGAALGSSYIKYMVDELEDNDESGYERVVDPEKLLEKHGRCFFMFVHHEETSSDELFEEPPKPKQLGHYWLIPLRAEYLPYKNARRNTKLLKYMGQYAFLNQNDGSNNTRASDENGITQPPVSPSVIIWQDAKFFRDGFLYSIPRDYSTVLRTSSLTAVNNSNANDSNLEHLPCLSTMALPATKASFGRPLQDDVSKGLALSSYSRPRYKDHCQTIIDALHTRPDVTDSPDALIDQCERYMQFVTSEQKKVKTAREDDGDDEEETDSLNFGLIDSAFLVWNESTKECRDFNAILRCTMLDQLQCHSDRDQVLFPLIIHQLLAPKRNGENTVVAGDGSPYALKAVYYNSWTKKKSSVDRNWMPHAHDLDLVDSNIKTMPPYSTTVEGGQNGEQQVYVRMQRSACHWYYFNFEPNQPMGERSCGHKIWLKDNLKQQNPSLEQQLQIADWSEFSSSEDEDEDEYDMTVSANASPLSLAAERGHLDHIEAPYAANFHKCTSSEYETIPWVFKNGVEESAEPTLSCGTDKGKPSLFHQKLQQIVVDQKIRNFANKEQCSDLVLFGVAFEKDITGVLSTLDGEQSDGHAKRFEQRRKEMQSNHGNCFFLFVLEHDLPSKWKASNFDLNPSPLLRGAGNNQAVATSAVSSAGHYWIIPIDRELLPYESMKRNSKLFQYSGQFFFPDANTIIYQDISFFSKRYLNKQPVDYRELYPHSNDDPEPCLTVYSLPKNKASVGTRLRDEELFQGHCKHAINSKEKLTPDGTVVGVSLDPAGTSSLIQQCDAYLQFVYKRELDTDILNQGMVHTNFMSWNESTEFCRDFNAQLRCTILDQLHCHSMNDKVVFPFALYVNQMGLGSMTEYEYIEGDGRITRWPVDAEFEKNIHDLNFFRKISLKHEEREPAKRDVVKILRGRLHWAIEHSGVAE